MSYTAENFAELNVLMLYTKATSLDGIKIHHTAEPTVIAAAHAQLLFTMLSAYNKD